MTKTEKALLAELEDMRRAYLDFWGAHSSADLDQIGATPRVVKTPTADRLTRAR